MALLTRVGVGAACQRSSWSPFCSLSVLASSTPRAWIGRGGIARARAPASRLGASLASAIWRHCCCSSILRSRGRVCLRALASVPLPARLSVCLSVCLCVCLCACARASKSRKRRAVSAASRRQSSSVCSVCLQAQSAPLAKGSNLCIEFAYLRGRGGANPASSASRQEEEFIRLSGAHC